MNKDFQRALKAHDLEAIRRFPKADLHNHGWAGADPASVGAILGRRIVPLNHKLTSMKEMHDWAGEYFGNPDPKLRPQLFEAAFVRGVQDGLVRYEIGDDVYIPERRGYGGPRYCTAARGTFKTGRFG
jgi:hypothetical protein